MMQAKILSLHHPSTVNVKIAASWWGQKKCVSGPMGHKFDMPGVNNAIQDQIHLMGRYIQQMTPCSFGGGCVCHINVP